MTVRTYILREREREGEGAWECVWGPTPMSREIIWWSGRLRMLVDTYGQLLCTRDMHV